MARRLRIGYIGLGNIGLPMAANLIEYIQLHRESRLVVWNRTKDKYDLLPDARGVEDLDDLFSTQCNVIFTSFANDSVAEEVYATVFTKAQNAGTGDKIFVDQSTLNPKTSGMLSLSLTGPSHLWNIAELS
jgi:3-hydroxyisobutyrate dehydrogenase-like beta-hydroxyacid dehydrogenase